MFQFLNNDMFESKHVIFVLYRYRQPAGSNRIPAQYGLAGLIVKAGTRSM